ncbi:RING finger protein 32 [Mantella aurantiaca]
MAHHLSSRPSRASVSVTSVTKPSKNYNGNQQPVILTAVALQDHILQNLQLQHLSLVDPCKGVSSIRSARPVNKRQMKAVVDTGIRRKHIDKVTLKGTEEEYVLDPAGPPLTLAQRLGIVEAPAKPLTDDEWKKVKQRSVEQGDSLQPCAICKEEFEMHSQVLLSCSHVFHRVCLQAYERFAGRKVCPMCRKNHYQTRVIHDGARLFRAKCAIRIQACWRGYIVRKWYKKLRQITPPKDPDLRKKFFENKFTEISDRLLRSCSTNIDVLFREIDQSVAASRCVFRLLEENFSRDISDADWERIQVQAVHQEISDCPICITPLNYNEDHRGQSSPRPIVLLSCSHVFHHACLQAFEDFSVGKCHICPLCRSPYQKKTFSC